MTLRILVVEDEFVIAMDLATMIEALGHEICAEASDVDEAVEAAGEKRPDLVLMDIRLAHGTSGIDAAAEIRKRYGIRTVFCSGNIDDRVRARLLALDPLGFVDKPASLYTIDRVLRNAERELDR